MRTAPGIFSSISEMFRPLSIFTLLAVLLSIGSCEEEEESIESKLEGTWELHESWGWIPQPAPPGNGTIFVFTKKEYTFYRERKLERQGKYKIVRYKSNLTGEWTNRLILDPDSNVVDWALMIEVHRKFLAIEPDAYDAGTTIYARIK